MTREPQATLPLMLGLALISASVLVLEIALTRYFSFRLWYHYGFMIIGVALLGLSAASVAMAAFRARLDKIPVPVVLAVSSLAFAISTLLALPILELLCLGFLAGHSSLTSTFLRIAGFWMTLLVPFFFAGCTVSWAIRHFANKITVAYAFDLLGASVGCAVAVWLLFEVYPESAIAVVSVAATAGGLLFYSARGVPPRSFVLAAAGALGLAWFAFNFAADPFYPTVTAEKGLHQDLALGGRILASRPGLTGRVDVTQVKAKAFSLAQTMGFSRLNTAFPDQLTIRIDASALTSIIRRDGDRRKWGFTDVMPSSLPYYVGSPKRVLVIGAGGGVDVANAVDRGAEQVTGVEINRQVVELVRDDFGTFSGNIYRDPRVRVVISDGRNFVENSRQKFDLIQLTLVDTFAAISSGALSLSEDFLYTTEAFRSYLRTLTDDGYLVLGRTRGEIMYLSVLLRAATDDAGPDYDMRQHLLAAESTLGEHGLIFLYKKSPLTSAEVERGKRFIARAGLRLLHAPGMPSALDPDVNRLLASKDLRAFIQTFKGDIRAETDDFPFYFRTSKWSLLGTFNAGRGNLLIMLVIATLFGLGFIVAPLWFTARPALRGNTASLAFFFFIGLGFITVELVLMVKFGLFLGHPVRSLTVTLFGLLAFSGLGSVLSRRILVRASGDSARARAILIMPFVGIVLGGLVYGRLLDGLFSGWMGLELWLRVLLSVALIAPLGLLLGMPLPVGMARIGERRPELILWAWGLNGVASVIGSVACVLVAQTAGYSVSLAAGLSCYVCAGACLLWGERRSTVRDAAPWADALAAQKTG